MKKRILSFVMLLAMLLGTVAVIPVGAASADAGVLKTTSLGWDGTTAEEPKTIEYGEGEEAQPKGSKANPYQISKAAHLKWLSDLVNKGGNAEIHCKQTASIDLNGRDMKCIGDMLTISTSGAPSTARCFKGVYDGQGYTIKNGRFVPAQANTNLQYVSGMFGALWGATVQNLVFDNVRVAGNQIVGMVAGYAYADYSKALDTATANCIRDITVKDNCLIERFGTAATVKTDSAWGGIVGEALNTVIANCVSEAHIQLGHTVVRVGGIAGVIGFGTTVSHCKHNGTIEFTSAVTQVERELHIGGIVGSWCSFGTLAQGTNSINHCINEGTFKSGAMAEGNKTPHFCLGGILGGTASFLANSTYTFENNYNLSNEATWSHSNVTAPKRVGGVVGCFDITTDADTQANVKVNDCHTVAYTAITPSTDYALGTVIGANRGATETDCTIVAAEDILNLALYRELATRNFVSSDFGWNGSVAVAPQGSGTKDDPYLVSSAENLKWMQAFIHNGAQYFKTFGFNHEEWSPDYSWIDTEVNPEKDLAIECSKTVDYSSFKNAPQVYFKQTCDIDLNGHTITSIASYIPATVENGKASTKGQWFGGHYDGQGFAIKNGKIKGSGTNANWNGGLFGVLWGATIENIVFDNIYSYSNETTAMVAGKTLNLRDFDSSQTADPSIFERETVIRNIQIKSNCTIEHVGNRNGNICVGGILAEAHDNTRVENCVNKADIIVDAQAQSVGGIVGLLYSGTVVNNCINYGDLYFTGTQTAGTYHKLMKQTAFGGIVGSWGEDGERGAVSGDMAITNCINFGTFRSEKITTGDLMSYGGILGRTLGTVTGEDTTYTFENNINLGECPTDHITANVKGTGANRAAALIGSAWTGEDYEWTQIVAKNCYSIPFTAGPGYKYTALVASTSKKTPTLASSRRCATADSTSKVLQTREEVMGLPLFVQINQAVTGFEHEFLGAQAKRNANGTYSLRLISGIDSLEYKGLAYDIVLTLGDKQGAKTYTAKEVYTSFVENGYGGKTVRYASDFGYSYLSLFTFTGLAKDSTYTIAYTPKVTYADGTMGKGDTVVLKVTNDEIEYVDMTAPVSGQMLINGVDISKYTILYVKDDEPTYYAADALRKYIRKATGYELPMAASSTNATYEIRVGFSEKGNTTAKGTYSVIQTDDDLELLFSGVLAAEQVIDQMAKLYLNNRDYEVDLRTVGDKLSVQANHFTKGDITGPKTVTAVYKKDTGDVRIMYQNVHGYTAVKDANLNSGRAENASGITNSELYDDVLEIYKGMLISYDPDIFCLQEANANAEKIVTLLKNSGYTMYRYSDTKGFGLPIFYKTDRFTEVKRGLTWVTTGTINNTVTGNNYCSPWIILADKQNANKEFAVFNSHFTADSAVTGKDPVTGEVLHLHGPCTVRRDFLAQQLKKVVNDVMNQYGVKTVITGGDYNHRMNDPVEYNYNDYTQYNPVGTYKYTSGTYDPYATMTTGTNALINVRDLINPANVGWYGLARGHKYDFNTGMYDLTTSGVNNATDSIDNILCRFSGTPAITLKRFQTCTDRITATSSDHPAQFVDFAWK